jgi:hypothetical protein
MKCVNIDYRTEYMANDHLLFEGGDPFNCS